MLFIFSCDLLFTSLCFPRQGQGGEANGNLAALSLFQSRPSLLAECPLMQLHPTDLFLPSLCCSSPRWLLSEGAASHPPDVQMVGERPWPWTRCWLVPFTAPSALTVLWLVSAEIGVSVLTKKSCLYSCSGPADVTPCVITQPLFPPWEPSTPTAEQTPSPL